jgi:hypothetical protein
MLYGMGQINLHVGFQQYKPSVAPAAGLFLVSDPGRRKQKRAAEMLDCNSAAQTING